MVLTVYSVASVGEVILMRMANERNRYADQIRPAKSNTYLFGDWNPLTIISDIKIMIALLFTMSSVGMPDIKLYWSRNHIIETPIALNTTF